MPLNRTPLMIKRDPRQEPTQLSFRLPIAYREQLELEAQAFGMSMPKFILEVLMQAIPPK
jgi:hypothetical protein